MKTLKLIKANALTKEEQKRIKGGSGAELQGELYQYVCTRANGSSGPVGAYSQAHLNAFIDRNNARCNAGYEIVGCYLRDS